MDEAIQFHPRPNICHQFLIFLSREFVLQFRMMRTIFLDVFLVLMAGGILGALYQEVSSILVTRLRFSVRQFEGSTDAMPLSYV